MRSLFFLPLLGLAASAAAQKPKAAYYPGRGGWEHRAPAQAGFDDAKLQAAIAYAQTVTDTTRTDSIGIASARPNEAPYTDVLGPWLTPRGPEGGVVIRGGY